MRRAMVPCNEVQTEVITEGRWIEEDPLPHSSKHVVLVIPGNPGLPLFYEGFIKAIYSRLSSDIPVWVVGHAGHVQPPEYLAVSMPSEEKWKECYSLAAQVRHKIEFIKKYVPEDTKVYLVGYSIGAWCVLNMLKDEDIAKRTKKCYLLFPAVEYLARSPNGKFLINFVRYIVPLLAFLFWFIVTVCPMFLQRLLARIFGIFYGIPARYSHVIEQMMNPLVTYRLNRLGREQMKYVKEADHKTISQYADKLWFYYGASDGWVPVEYYENMKTRHPDVDIELCQRGFPHAFMLNNDVDMGHIVGDLVNEECLKDPRC